MSRLPRLSGSANPTLPASSFALWGERDARKPVRNTRDRGKRGERAGVVSPPRCAGVRKLLIGAVVGRRGVGRDDGVDEMGGRSYDELKSPTGGSPRVW